MCVYIYIYTHSVVYNSYSVNVNNNAVDTIIIIIVTTIIIMCMFIIRHA